MKDIIFVVPTYWSTILIPHKSVTLSNLVPSPYLVSAITISTNVYSITYGVKSSAYGISALLNTLLNSLENLGSSSNISVQYYGLGLDPSYPRLSVFRIWCISVSNFTKVSLTSSVDNSILVMCCNMDLNISLPV